MKKLKTFRLKDYSFFTAKIGVILNDREKLVEEPEHQHDYCELMFILSGTGNNVIDGFSYPLIPGDLFIILPGSIHSFQNTAPLKFLNLMFSFSILTRREQTLLRNIPGFTELFQVRGNELRISKLFIPHPYSNRLHGILEKIHADCQKHEAGAVLRSKAYLLLLLEEICRVYTSLEKEGIHSQTDTFQVTTLNRILHFINRNYLRKITMKEIARESNISPTYLGEFFRKHMGVNPVKYIIRLRLEHARLLLEGTAPHTITEIALQSGFENVCYFAKSFRNVIGVSPSEYRRSKHMASDLK